MFLNKPITCSQRAVSESRKKKERGSEIFMSKRLVHSFINFKKYYLNLKTVKTHSF